MDANNRTPIPQRPLGPLLCTGRIWSELDGWSGCELTDELGALYHKVQKARPVYDERWYEVGEDQWTPGNATNAGHINCSGLAQGSQLSAVAQTAGRHGAIPKMASESRLGDTAWLPETAAKALTLPVIDRRRKGRGYRCLCAVDAGTVAALQEQARRHRVPAVRAACKQAVERIEG